MQQYKHSRRPTVGVLAGWEAYGNANLVNYLDPLLHGIRAAAVDRKCNLLLSCGAGPPGTQAGSVHPAWPVPSPETDFVPVGPWNTDGLIVVNPLVSEARAGYVLDLLAARYPVVFVGAALGGPAIAIDNEGGIRQAVAHLVEHGHRGLAFIAGNPEDRHGDTEERLQAYRAAVEEHGLAFNPALVVYGFHIVDGGQLAMRQLLATRLPFTAVLASSDECAIGALMELKDAGLRVPQDMAVVGFDDEPEAMLQTPPLTTVHSPTFERGYRALELLLATIEGRNQEAEIVKVATRLTVRQSCGCLPDQGASTRFRALLPPELRAGGGLVTSWLGRALAEAVLAETRRLSSDEVHTLGRRLAQAFIAGLEQEEPAGFMATLAEILRRVEEAGEDAHAWQRALLTLQGELPALLEAVGRPATYRPAGEMLYLADAAISRAGQHQYLQYVFDQKWLADRMAVLTYQLLAALDEKQVFAALAEHLPEMGIRYAGVAFFEPAGDDPVAWSVLRTIPNLAATSIRFPSRAFPPRELPAGEPFHLALLPLVIEGESVGFAAFEATKLELYGVIVQQLAVAFKSAWLYREAAGGQTLAEEAALAHIAQALARRRQLGSDRQRLVRKAMAYIHEHYPGPITRADIARYVGTSDDHLTRCFRQEMGLTPMVYLNRYRVKQAKALLAAGGRSVTEVAMAVGFSDSGYFSQVFRREVGMSPSAYKHSF
ncbi:MAG: substrate-binding domain-containing protein [Chloroflexi bacterium]|nr:substrate-binding domain-containing protein [Chloroflexota bacterium]MCI0577922.1 substrate-binding domain-containing protein [Chloroflexota bacterium]MCI0645802.1 substrate-binding domain-containing protein [Chloroflexota bacterium]MCI0727271.1 substrate-binding domain-containing protein [Chloroflexota bacterium]